VGLLVTSSLPYLFLGIGLVGERIKTLKTEGDKIKAQMGSKTATNDNALGKIMLAFEAKQNS
jgi:hypothetical protein